MNFRSFIFAAPLAVLVSGCGFSDLIGANRAHNYATLIHSEDSLGFGLGAEAPFRDSPVSMGVEVGGFKRSNEASAVYALTHVEYDLMETRTRPPRIGAFVGFLNDEGVADRFRDRYPVIGNFAPFFGVQATVPTFGPHELRIRIAPGLSAQTAVFTLQSNFVF